MPTFRANKLLGLLGEKMLKGCEALGGQMYNTTPHLFFHADHLPLLLFPLIFLPPSPLPPPFHSKLKPRLGIFDN